MRAAVLNASTGNAGTAVTLNDLTSGQDTDNAGTAVTLNNLASGQDIVKGRSKRRQLRSELAPKSPRSERACTNTQLESEIACSGAIVGI